jgi:hypothetical protein
MRDGESLPTLARPIHSEPLPERDAVAAETPDLRLHSPPRAKTSQPVKPKSSHHARYKVSAMGKRLPAGPLSLSRFAVPCSAARTRTTPLKAFTPYTFRRSSACVPRMPPVTAARFSRRSTPCPVPATLCETAAQCGRILGSAACPTCPNSRQRRGQSTAPHRNHHQAQLAATCHPSAR